MSKFYISRKANISFDVKIKLSKFRIILEDINNHRTSFVFNLENIKDLQKKV